MNQINVRYGEDLTLSLDADDAFAVSADIYIGKPGQMYVLTKHADLVGGVGTFVFSTTDTEIPLDTYFYQINVTDSLGQVEKYPSPEDNCGDCESDFPEFTVNEALDLMEVS